MKTVTKSVIKLSEIPENLQRNEIFIDHKIHTYAIFHIDNLEEDELSLWLIKNYPTIKMKRSFLIHIDKQIELNKKYSNADILNALHSLELQDNKNYSNIYDGIKKWYYSNIQ